MGFFRSRKRVEREAVLDAAMLERLDLAIERRKRVAEALGVHPSDVGRMPMEFVLDQLAHLAMANRK